MNHFQYHGNELYAEEVALKEIVARVGSPVYVYSHATLTRHFKAFDDAFSSMPHTICYSVKANSTMAVLKTFINLGGGVDIVSGGELFRALKAGVDPQKVVYSGVGKKDDEIEYAFNTGILMFNVESEQELTRISGIASRLGKKAGIAIRVNPDVDPGTHPYITTGLKNAKFGITIDRAMAEYTRANDPAGHRRHRHRHAHRLPVDKGQPLCRFHREAEGDDRQAAEPGDRPEILRLRRWSRYPVQR